MDKNFVLVAVLSVLVLTSVYLYTYLQTRSRAMGLWTLAGTLSFLRHVAALYIAAAPPLSVVSIITGCGIQQWLFLLGQYCVIMWRYVYFCRKADATVSSTYICGVIAFQVF